MKKILALVMVLGIASLATAGWAPVISGAGSTITISNTFDGEGAPDGTWLGSTLAIDHGSVIAGPAAGSNFASSDGGAWGGPTWLQTNYPVVPGIGSWADGVVYTVELIGADAGWVWTTEAAGAVAQVDLYDAGGASVQGTIYAIPEPATMALLGLGALVLRRKK